MLRLRHIEVSGFGPFETAQRIDFPSEPGVTVVYGENMRGKTSLLNAIRYAFFGNVLGRGAKSRKLRTLVNRDCAARGDYRFSVRLKFDHDQTAYELIRECSSTSKDPKLDSEFDQDVMLKRGSSVLGPDQRDLALKQIFPEEVSRFFLFDGELLQQYESLLINESATGKEISDAIERILGVPLLKQARNHLSRLSADAEAAAAREASKHQETRVKGTALQNALALRDSHKAEIDRKETDLRALQKDRVEAEEELRAQAKYAGLLEDRENAVAQVAKLKAEAENLSEEIRLLMAAAWRGLLAGPVASARQAAQATVKVKVAQMVSDLRRKAVENRHCDVCDQDLDSARIIALRNSLSTPDESEEVNATLIRLADVSRVSVQDNGSQIKAAVRRAREVDRNLVTLADKVEEITGRLKDADPDAIRRTKASFADVIQRITIIEQGIAEERKQFAAADEAVQRLQRELRSHATQDLAAAQRRATILRDSAAVFGQAIERYKSKLRDKVQATATDLFKAMTTEKSDYAALSINESYGLTIQHTDGRAEEARSAGAEHIVALALMGALQKNAPLRGPIVMDSPFGRLDEQHTSNVVTALPKMADQVVLLVYEAEVGKRRMRELLGGSLKKEYELRYQSARRTEIALVK